MYKDPASFVGYEPLKCSKMDINVDCYFSTAIVSIHGEWKNDSDKDHFIFVLSTKGSITNCTIRIVGQNHCHVRTVGIIDVDRYQTLGNTQTVEYVSN